MFPNLSVRYRQTGSPSTVFWRTFHDKIGRLVSCIAKPSTPNSRKMQFVKNFLNNKPHFPPKLKDELFKQGLNRRSSMFRSLLKEGIGAQVPLTENLRD